MSLQNKVLDNINSLVLILNQEQEVSYVSPSVKEILNYYPEELMGDKWWEATRFGADDIKQAKDRLSSFVMDADSHQKRTFENKIKIANGKSKWILWNISFLDEQNIIAIGNDISKRKQYEFLLEEKNKQIEESRKEILSGIRYSQRIQEAILPNIDVLQKSFTDIFVLHKPKDIVSGDFYWFHKTEKYNYIAAIDCTGHGVSGAMLTTIGNSLIREIVVRDKILSPAKILTELDKRLTESLNNNGHSYKISDGMDVALCRIDNQNSKICFSGAYRPMIKVNKEEILEIKPDRFPIGLYGIENKSFTETEIDYTPEDMFYIFSDGYVDQFGGERNKKMNKSRFKELLLTVEDFTCEEKHSFLEYSLNNWKQDTEQTDDILIVGFVP